MKKFTLLATGFDRHMTVNLIKVTLLRKSTRSWSAAVLIMVISLQSGKKDKSGNSLSLKIDLLESKFVHVSLMDGRVYFKTVMNNKAWLFSVLFY